MADDDQVILQSQDGQDFKVEVKVAKQSETVKNLIEDAGVKAPIPLPNVSGKILSKVVEWCKYHTEHPTVVSEEQKDEKPSSEISAWDLEFTKVDQPTLFELILAANYLDIKGLLSLVCKTVANMIKGKTPEEIRKTFGIKESFSESEKNQVRLENEFCEER
tara:strand:- start:19683 stop:20168 length:486 start_codon:yes stop_codon:yes gene_type:complete